MQFSTEQMNAIRHIKGPALVVAGPGSGKTSVICERIRYLISLGVNPDKVLVITFSKEAARSMQLKFNEQNHSITPVCFSTFHSYFYSILRDYYHYNNNVADVSLKFKILKNIFEYKRLLSSDDVFEQLINRISYFKSNGKTMDIEDDTNIDSKLFMEIYDEYNTMLESLNKIDFDDMVIKCDELLRHDTELRNRLKKRYEYILIDEYQDINAMQQSIMEMLLNDEQNLFCVGDDDQSIYGFRGANPYIMNDFKDKFSNCKIYYLSCNYRCSQNIVHVAAEIISKNSKRLLKDIYTINEPGCEVSVKGFNDAWEENLYILDELKKSILKKETVAVLFRTNNGFEKLLALIHKNKIECNIREKVRNIYESIEFKDFIHYMNMTSGIINSNDLIAVLNKPTRYISRNIIIGDVVNLDEIINKCDKAYIINNLVKLRNELKMLKKMDMFCAFNYFRNVIGYEDYLKKNNSYNHKLMDEIQNSLKGITNMDSLCEYVCAYSYALTKNNVHKPCSVNVMTYHSAKGLEFDKVILPDLNEGYVPSKKAITIDALEEERRMLYVAMTRAKNELHMTYCGGDDGTKSRFLYDFNKSC